jgi:UDP:flavonoid glycosyltransferase YjiC (YdhE family)
MENFINQGGNEGFIYVSFGSGAKISAATKELQDKFYNAFKNSKIRFLWKWEGARPKDMPANVYTAEWMPQQAILGTQ